MAGRKKLTDGKKKVRIDPFIEERMVDKIGKKKCEEISVLAVIEEFNRVNR